MFSFLRNERKLKRDIIKYISTFVLLGLSKRFKHLDPLDSGLMTVLIMVSLVKFL